MKIHFVSYNKRKKAFTTYTEFLKFGSLITVSNYTSATSNSS